MDILKRSVNKMRELYKGGFFHIILGGMLSKMIAFISSIVIVRLVDKEAYAALAYADNIYSYITLVAGLGMASAVLKFAIGEKEKNYVFYRFSFLWGSLFQIVLLIAVCIVIGFINIPFQGTKALLYLLIPYGLLYYWGSLIQSFFRTEFQNERYAKFSFLQVFLTFVLSIIGVLNIGIAGVPLARAGALIAAILLYGKNFFSVLVRKISNIKLTNIEKKSFLIMAFSLLISNVFSMIMPLNESFLVNNLIADEVITANYKVANLIPSQLAFVTSSIVIYYFPIIAKESGRAAVWKKAVSIGKWVGALIGVISIVGIVITPIILQIVYGDQYSDARLISRMLWIAYGLNAGFRMFPMNVLPAIGCTKYNVIISGASCVVHFILDYIFIQNWGIYGVVYATGLVYLGTGFLYWYYLAKQTILIRVQ